MSREWNDRVFLLALIVGFVALALDATTLSTLAFGVGCGWSLRGSAESIIAIRKLHRERRVA